VHIASRNPAAAARNLATILEKIPPPRPAGHVVISELFAGPAVLRSAALSGTGAPLRTQIYNRSKQSTLQPAAAKDGPASRFPSTPPHALRAGRGARPGSKPCPQTKRRGEPHPLFRTATQKLIPSRPVIAQFSVNQRLRTVELNSQVFLAPLGAPFLAAVHLVEAGRFECGARQRLIEAIPLARLRADGEVAGFRTRLGLPCEAVVRLLLRRAGLEAGKDGVRTGNVPVGAAGTHR
jgi:hypothetical protein